MARNKLITVTTAETSLYLSGAEGSTGPDGAPAGAVYVKNVGSSTAYIRSNSLGHETKANGGGFPIGPGETSPALMGPRVSSGALLDVSGWAATGTTDLHVLVAMGVAGS